MALHIQLASEKLAICPLARVSPYRLASSAGGVGERLIPCQSLALRFGISRFIEINRDISRGIEISPIYR